MNAKNTIIAAIKLLLNDRGVGCRNAFVTKTRRRTRVISVIVLLLVGRFQKRAAALSARERSEFIPTWKQALAEWLGGPAENGIYQMDASFWVPSSMFIA